MSGKEAGPSDPGKARKFKPTIPARRKKAVDEGPAVKSENDETFKDLLRAAQEPANWHREQQRRGGPKSAGSQQVAFGGHQAGVLRPPTFRAPSNAGRAAVNASNKGLTNGSKLDGFAFPPADEKDSKATTKKLIRKSEGLLNEDSKDNRNFMDPPAVEEDEEMLDMDAYYPTVLPQNRPGATGETSDDTFNQNLLLHPREDEDVAEALGLLRSDDDSSTADILLQLPSVLPSSVKEAKNEPLDRRRKLTAHVPEPERKSAHALHELPPGKIGKLLVFESGKVKLQLGEVLLDVNLGSDCQCFQQVVAFNMAEKSALTLGEIQHRAVCTPDMDQLLSNKAIPQWERADSVASPRRADLAKNLPNGHNDVHRNPDAMEIDDEPKQANGSHAPEKRKQKKPHKVLVDSDDEMQIETAKDGRERIS